ncbi:MAG: sigma-70 family RNA polymerase sigma factor, partial [Rhodothermales bacterium]|nr:sigma-70 family RNA polymerase sigma factor [Rhodothermales bacterium]
CLNTMRRDKRQVGFGEGLENIPADATPVSRMEKSERIALVSEALLRLKPEYREVLILREYQNLSYDEIAAVTRSTVSAVKSRLFKSRRKLASLLSPTIADEPRAAQVKSGVRAKA